MIGARLPSSNRPAKDQQEASHCVPTQRQALRSLLVRWPQFDLPLVDSRSSFPKEDHSTSTCAVVLHACLPSAVVFLYNSRATALHGSSALKRLKSRLFELRQPRWGHNYSRTSTRHLPTKRKHRSQAVAEWFELSETHPSS